VQLVSDVSPNADIVRWVVIVSLHIVSSDPAGEKPKYSAKKRPHLHPVFQLSSVSYYCISASCSVIDSVSSASGVGNFLAVAGRIRLPAP
jgi:hypothetical protein